MARRSRRGAGRAETPTGELRSGKPDAAGAVVETRVFRSGNSDAVRLPRRFGLSGKLVRLYRGAGDRVIIEPKARRRWPPGFLTSFGRVTPDFEPGQLPPMSPEEEARAASRFRSGS